MPMPPPSMSDMEYLNNLVLDGEQSSIDMWSVAVEKVTNFDW
jgi:hypothetical protein